MTYRTYTRSTQERRAKYEGR